jgi:Cof subfamily protein (haloacid dehalogenase superfamily)
MVTSHEPTVAAQPGRVAAVVADVDGTLLTRGTVLTPRARQAVQRLHSLGVPFAITSGRPPRGMRMLVEPLGLRAPMAAFNGGIIVMPDMTIVDERDVAGDLAAAVIETMWAHGLYVWIYRGAELCATDADTPRPHRESAAVQFPPSIARSDEDLLERVVKIVGVSDDPARVSTCETAVQRRFEDRVSASRSQPHHLDVTHPAANTGAVVERLSAHYGIPLGNVATFGDQANDLLMFERSGLSIAMGNADEDVKRRASHVTSSNEEDGFARAIEDIILPRAGPLPTS